MEKATAKVTTNLEASNSHREEIEIMVKKIFRVHIVACMQILFASFSIGLVIAYGTFATIFTVSLDQLHENLPKWQHDGFISLVWIAFAIYAFETGLQILASLRLLKSTEIGVSNAQALECIRFWIYVTIITTIPIFMALIALQVIPAGFVFIAFRAYFLCQVFPYKMALEKKLMNVRVSVKHSIQQMPIEIIVIKK